MATPFSVGDRVVFRSLFAGLPSTDYFPLTEPPHLGYIEDLTSDLADVLWDNGVLDLNLPADSAAASAICILRTRAPQPASLDLQGQRVKRMLNATIAFSPEFSGLVVALLGVETNIDSNVYQEYALVYTDSKVWYWAPVDNLQVTP